jgi:hypothetical protein
LRKRLPARVARYLEGVEFPARKEELLGRLERNGVPGPIVDQLSKRLPEGEYRWRLRDGTGRTVARSSARYRAKADYTQIHSGQW